LTIVRRDGTSSPGTTHLADELLIRARVAVRAQGLLEEGEEDGDDDARLQAFPEADEEDCRHTSLGEHGRAGLPAARALTGDGKELDHLAGWVFCRERRERI
jgi:hypothetical protein